MRLLSSVMSSLLPLPAGHREQDRPLSLTSWELAHGGPRTQGGCARFSLKGEVLPATAAGTWMGAPLYCKEAGGFSPTRVASQAARKSQA